MRLKYDKSRPIYELPGSILQDIQAYLELTKGTQKWRAFYEAAESIGDRYSLSHLEAENQGISSKPSNLVKELNSRGLIIEELVRILDAIGEEPIQKRLRNEEPLVIHSITDDLSVPIGESVYLEVSAEGFPYPKYQWFRRKDQDLEFVIGGVFGTLQIRFVTLEDSGIYLCGIRRYPDEKFVFSREIDVTVIHQEREIEENDEENVPERACEVSLITDELSKFHFDEQSETKCLEFSDDNITYHPVSQSKRIGESCSFLCKADSSKPLSFQWFKDGEMIPAATDNVFNINKIDAASPGKYQCKVLCTESRRECLSYVAELDVHNLLSIETIYTPRDKVALLIGNWDYSALSSLGQIPMQDIATLTEHFKLLDFKVISLINLTMTEMKNIVREFVQLIGEGVYSVFYFCGHGIDHNGSSLLIPVDVPEGFLPYHCINVNEVIHEIQMANPDLAVMILDVCRTGRHYPPGQTIPFSQPTLKHRGNTVFLYATSEGLESYQIKGEENGVLVKHLKRFLNSSKPVLGVFQDVLEDFHLNPDKSKGKQIPQIKTTLMEPRRSLADRINYNGHTTTFILRCQQWGRFASKDSDPPRIRPIQIKELGLRIKVTCKMEFCNVLRISWDDPKGTERIVIKKCTFDGFPSEELNLRFLIEYEDKVIEPEEKKEKTKTYVVDGIYLGFPLASALWLWKREAVEQSEDETE
ncbi:hypothetical protein FSP39_001759 [Pinctada imbricata]|uniref:Mucosa-associated lymphoid tissue lymphoma translocation protein 1 n=1 Tax=Pinctada imbricata TaxID=66713 RepID=A0AA88Y1I7_PINIB|nr:hypothetical protein FSP39_001759 [Pinctada imbricata]